MKMSMKTIKQAVSFLFETNKDRVGTRGMGLVDPAQDEFLLNKRENKVNGFRSFYLSNCDVMMDSESFLLNTGPRYLEDDVDE